MPPSSPPARRPDSAPSGSPTARRRGPSLDLILPALVWVAWLLLVWGGDLWRVVVDNWFMAATMAFGSFIAGSTSEGGGAVAFPVMTLLFGIEPRVARDFSFMIQSVGMTAAAITIAYNRIPVEWRAVLWSGLGGAAGLIVGVELVAPLLSPAPTKIFFVSLWLSFGAALLWMNRVRDRTVLEGIRDFGANHRLILITVGGIGGVISGLTGSGLDIVTFSLLVLAFGLSEKVATPTSVVLMAGNAVVGFAWRALTSYGPDVFTGLTSAPLSAEAWGYWWAAAPVVVVGAPLGARFIAGRSRRFVVGLLLVSIVAQYLGALLILPVGGALTVFSLATVTGGVLLFGSMARYGGRLRLGRGGEDEISGSS